MCVYNYIYVYILHVYLVSNRAARPWRPRYMIIITTTDIIVNLIIAIIIITISYVILSPSLYIYIYIYTHNMHIHILQREHKASKTPNDKCLPGRPAHLGLGGPDIHS